MEGAGDCSDRHLLTYIIHGNDRHSSLLHPPEIPVSVRIGEKECVHVDASCQYNKGTNDFDYVGPQTPEVVPKKSQRSLGIASLAMASLLEEWKNSRVSKYLRV